MSIIYNVHANKNIHKSKYFDHVSEIALNFFFFFLLFRLTNTLLEKITPAVFVYLYV